MVAYYLLVVDKLGAVGNSCITGIVDITVTTGRLIYAIFTNQAI